MINFENVSKGLKRIFSAEILQIISIAAGVVAALVGLLSAASLLTGSMTGAAGFGIATGVLGIGAGVLAIISFIMECVGLGTAGKENNQFKYALYVIILAIILVIVNFILKLVFGGDSLGTRIIDSAQNVVDIIVSLFVIQGCIDLNKARGHKDLASKGSVVATRVLIAFILSFVLNIIPTFANGTLAVVCTILYLVCSLIAYIQYLAYVKTTSTAILSAGADA